MSSSVYPQTLEFIQGNTKEGIKFTLTNAETGAEIDISGATEVIFRVFSQNFQTLIFEGKESTGEIDLTYGNDNQCRWMPNQNDFNTTGTFLGELEVLHEDGRYSFDQALIIKVKPKAPTS